MNKPDFTGVWRFNSGKSLLEIPSPDSTLFVIDHHEPDFHLERTHTHGETSDTFSIDLTTDGGPVTKNHGDIEIRARLYWDGDVLVFDSRLIQGGQEGSNIVRYQLAEDGQIFVAVERLSLGVHRHTNTWVFEKQKPQGYPAPWK